MDKTNEIVLFETEDKEITLTVKIKKYEKDDYVKNGEGQYQISRTLIRWGCI